ncbi:hypothetical protein GSI_09753 [Ganoderma sinense ZZ0214-1]|uniref:Uncharacterized protein n=1 Tax=Ganoderma sinense ZZ0214-1 TaxID=1077348 RepID=A0A2G8S2X4_9APHY|nr:hypothetical protein GSI_09753 [Ganoderma sinense ZZ0214-1]
MGPVCSYEVYQWFGSVPAFLPTHLPTSSPDVRVSSAPTSPSTIRSTPNSPRTRNLCSLNSSLSLPLRPPWGILGCRLDCTPASGENWHPASLSQRISHLPPTLERLEFEQFTVDPAEICAITHAHARVYASSPSTMQCSALVRHGVPHRRAAAHSILHCFLALVFYILGLGCFVRLAMLIARRRPQQGFGWAA